jgi:hypothetical protein
MRKPYTLKDIIQIADRVYPDGLVGQAFKAEQGPPPKEVGDTLATFIVRELKDTFDPKATALDQINEARRVIARASIELGDVARTFRDVASDLAVNAR